MVEPGPTTTGPDSWTQDLDKCVQLKNEIRHMIQERNSKHHNGGPEASRITATSRRKIGTLKSLIDGLQTSIESEEYSSLSENEKNRRRNLLLGLRQDRDDMIQSLKRPIRQVATETLRSRFETDATSERNNHQLLVMQTALMQEQDDALEHLDRSVVTTKNIAIQINDETQLQNRLLEEFDNDVDETRERLGIVRKKLRMVMQRASGWTAPLLLFVTIVILLVLLVMALKIL